MRMPPRNESPMNTTVSRATVEATSRRRWAWCRTSSPRSPFHTEAAKLFGATDEEIREAVHYAKTSLGWSAFINGMREDYDRFAAELAQIGQYLQSKG